MVKLTALEYWHSFRPPHRTAVFVNPHDVVSVSQLPFDERRSETVSEVVTRYGGKTFLVEGNSEEIAEQLASDAIASQLG